MKVLLVDDDPVVLDLLRIYLEDQIPGVEVTEYPSAERGRPGPEFDWSAYDVLLLDYHLGGGETGVAWLETFGSSPGFPRTIMITTVNDPYVVGNAIRVGAEGYLNKANLAPKLLADTVRDVLGNGLTGDTVADPEPESSQADEDVAARFAREAADAKNTVRANYRFGRRIGQGGMATVYIAERDVDGVTVVIKILDRKYFDDNVVVQRFVREGEVVSGIRSPYVVRIFDQGFTNSYAYIAMEFFGRGDLQQRIERGIPPEEAGTYLYNVARGLEIIHGAGIVHRDLKPANIMFRADDTLALADFGICKEIQSNLELTQSGSILGTLHYMSPEQFEGAPVSPSFDLYGAGVILHEMLTGRRPYVGRTFSSVVFQHSHAPIPMLEGPAARYQGVLEGLMAKRPEDRYRDASELCQSLIELGAAT